jgi:protein TonB
VEEANPPGLFDQSALDAFRNARFTPAQRHGRAVKSLVRIKVNYDLADRIMPIDKTKQK